MDDMVKMTGYETDSFRYKFCHLGLHILKVENNTIVSHNNQQKDNHHGIIFIPSSLQVLYSVLQTLIRVLIYIYNEVELRLVLGGL